VIQENPGGKFRACELIFSFAFNVDAEIDFAIVRGYNLKIFQYCQSSLTNNLQANALKLSQTHQRAGVKSG